jgi:hypothetical protein
VNTAKLVYRPVGMLAGALAGVAAGAVFKQVWRLAAGEDDAPRALDGEHTWTEVLAAAAIQGAIFSLVKAAVDRSAARGFQKVTGDWPG